MSTAAFDIEDLNRDGEGVWHAQVRAGALVVHLRNDSGSWMTPAIDERGNRREALPAVAAALQQRVALAVRNA